MRSLFPLLLVGCTLLSSLSQAQLTWSKSSYPIRTAGAGEHADFTGDGSPDLIFLGTAGTAILPNTGNGAFDSSRAFTTKEGQRAIADFNRDGKTDVALCDGANLVILLGSGDGALTVSQTVPVSCRFVVASDFDRDGNPDIAVTVDGSTNSGDNQVIVYLGDGSGGVSGKIVNDNVNFVSTAGSGGSACFLQGAAEAADFTGDKVADIAIAAPCPNGTFTNDALIVGVGDGTGHFTFHKDVEFGFDSLRMRLGDADQDGKRDFIVTGVSAAPHFFSSALFLLKGNGNGTFTFQQIASMDTDNAINSAAVADFDGDGIKDAVLAVQSIDPNTAQIVFSMQFLKGQLDGSYKLTQTSPLATSVLDLVSGDFDKDGRVDLALLRQSSTDIWLNQTSAAPICPALGDLRTVNLCSYGSPGGTFHFVANPLDNRHVNAVQIYIDGSLRFETPDDLLNTRLQVRGGTIRLTAKGWDDLGPFSTTINLLACLNDTFRTVTICSPANGSSSGNAVHIVASAATSLAFSQLQVYVDGVVRYRTSSQYVDIAPDLALGTHRITVKGWDSSGAFWNTI